MTVCIDLFAGPGGLGEGFSRAGFSIAISIEKERVECETLFKRKLHKLLLDDKQTADAEKIGSASYTMDELVNLYPELSEKAALQVAQLELGVVPFASVHERICRSLANQNDGPTILLGGPPCQAYSIVGRSRNIGKSKIAENPEFLTEFYSDARHTLYREYLKVLSVFEPDVFIMENVKGILSARASPNAPKGSVISTILADLRNPGKAMNSDHEFLAEVKSLNTSLTKSEYILVPLVEKGSDDLLEEVEEDAKPSDFLIRCEDHGIPQTRHRVIICGVRKDLFLKRGRPRQLQKSKTPATVRQVIGSFPKLRSDITREKVPADDWSKRVKNEISRLASISEPSVQSNAPKSAIVKQAPVRGDRDLSVFLEDSVGPITNHYTRSHMISDIARYHFCADFAEREGRSPKMQDWPVGKLAPDHKDIRNEGNRLIVSGFSDRFKVQMWDKPASTITSHISKDGHYFIHPDKTQCRSLSVREAARIQTFPDSYQFCGGISKQFHQIGNAVPPYLAFQIATIVGEYLAEGAAKE